MSVIRTRISLDDMQLLGISVAARVKPSLAIEAGSVDNKSVPVPVTDGMSVPRGILVLRVRPPVEIDLPVSGIVIVVKNDHEFRRLYHFDERIVPEHRVRKAISGRRQAAVGSARGQKRRRSRIGRDWPTPHAGEIGFAVRHPGSRPPRSHSPQARQRRFVPLSRCASHYYESQTPVPPLGGARLDHQTALLKPGEVTDGGNGKVVAARRQIRQREFAFTGGYSVE